MSRTFLQIMRDVYELRRAGMSPALALMSALDGDDAGWRTVFDRLVSSARLEGGLNRIARQNRRQGR